MLAKASYHRTMPKSKALTPAEERLWRALIRIVISLPRLLETDILRSTGLTSNEYITLMSLSEAPNRELRMAELANAAALSPSRITRLVDDLQSRGFVARQPSSSDGRGNVAILTTQGLTKLKSAYPEHLASVRRRVFDHMEPTTIDRTAQALSGLAAELENKPLLAAEERKS
jgi:DNA-binding MarR family transcriptional regulator